MEQSMHQGIEPNRTGSREKAKSLEIAVGKTASRTQEMNGHVRRTYPSLQDVRELGLPGK
jgi:hypothetical protein